ncbi:hypothetical protein HELRODRAFT_62236 [Helobdella robusta]|uniref:EH domain-containing protein 1 n=1 Tax=Helobdella robusta TaxID=6412 RepID=T1FWX5_HELRO|nr:hypothetical protein HELRODRAFT_62236 [Helobdella robusta]ESO13098.1 hypothetical protein HELRODRAFT_62236 [Helobdella robusta]
MFTLTRKSTLAKKEEHVNLCVSEGLKKVYKSKLLPLEEFYNFHDFHSPPLDDADFDAKPMILLVGQYSTGKTTFIRYLLEQDFPGMRIGPEPTTDSFIVVSYGEDNSVIPGNAVVVDKKKPFRALAKFGNAFLNRFQCSQVNNRVLESLSIIDTPGILAGEKQKADRGYNFAAVIEWLAERVDRIILLFDAHKLDISDEFRTVIESMKGYDDKIRIVLNKADMVDHQELMRVYGALMWSLGKVLNTPEVARVYIGSFWDQPLHFDANRKLFELEEQDLFQEIQNLPKNAAVRKLNDLIKRARMVKVHAYIMSHLKTQLPAFVGKKSKQNSLIHNLKETYAFVQNHYQISPGDFPNLKKMQEQLKMKDFTKFHTLRKKLLDTVDSMLEEDVPRFMQMIPKDEQVMRDMSIIKGGAFSEYLESPFGFNCGEGIERGKNEPEWVVYQGRAQYEEIFQTLGPVNGKISGLAAKKELMKSKLSNAILGKVWRLSDIDKDGLLDVEEFGLALYLIDLKLHGCELPHDLPDHLVPPSKVSHRRVGMVNGDVNGNHLAEISHVNVNGSVHNNHHHQQQQSPQQQQHKLNHAGTSSTECDFSDKLYPMPSSGAIKVEY